jgi:hypothetical protein
MTDSTTVGEIIAQYEKHGWTLRRALLSDASRTLLGNVLTGIDVTPSDFDALWFSRQSKPESEAWELRRLSVLPFALVAVVASNASNEEVEATLSQVADEMRDRTIA